MTDDKPRYRVAQGINQQGPGMICLLDNEVFIAEFNDKETAERFAAMGNLWGELIDSFEECASLCGSQRNCYPTKEYHDRLCVEHHELIAKAKEVVR